MVDYFLYIRYNVRIATLHCGLIKVECNLSPPCRHHHRTKQAPGWDLTQVQPGVMRWATPSGRIYETHPTIYDL
jgi:hypothetical protein